MLQFLDSGNRSSSKLIMQNFSKNRFELLISFHVDNRYFILVLNRIPVLLFEIPNQHVSHEWANQRVQEVERDENLTTV